MHNVIVYGFPVILVAFEFGLRTLVNADVSGFIGPTLAAAGLSFLVPLTKLRVLNIEVSDSNAVVISKRDKEFTSLVWLFILLFLFAWFWSCYLSISRPHDTVWIIPTHFGVGLIAYVISILLTVIKELFVLTQS